MTSTAGAMATSQVLPTNWKKKNYYLSLTKYEYIDNLGNFHNNKTYFP